MLFVLFSKLLTRALAAAAFAAAVLIAGSLIAYGKEPQALPVLDGVLHLGCTVQQNALPNGVAWWHVHVWADYEHGRLIKLYAIRPAEHRKKAILDCETWLKAARKEILEHHKKTLKAAKGEVQ